MGGYRSNNCLFLLTALMLVSFSVWAQEVVPENAGEEIVPENAGEEIVVEEESAMIDIKPEDLQTLFFLQGEYDALQDAKRLHAKGGNVRPADEPFLEIPDSSTVGSEEPKPKPPPEQRELKLGGILFLAEDDWIIWLNGKRVTPKAIPEEVIDLRVYNSYIEVKWLDDWSGQILPVKLKPHQRFNMDTKIFLPG